MDRFFEQRILPSVQPTLFEFIQGKEIEEERIVEQSGPHGKILQGHVLEVLKALPSESVQCCLTSPPYWGLRDYGLPPQIWGGKTDCQHEWTTDRYYIEKTAAHSSSEAFSEAGDGNAERLKKGRWREDRTCIQCGAWEGSLGLERTPELYANHLVQVFREVRRVLRQDGTLWLVLGDSYHGSWGGVSHDLEKKAKRMGYNTRPPSSYPIGGLKPTDLVGIPWLVAFALRTDGWYLHSDIIWNKVNPTPESVLKRPTKSHEYVFLLAKNGDPIYWAHPTKGGSRKKPEPDYRWEKRETHEVVDTEPAEWSTDSRVREFWRRLNLWRGYDYLYDGYAIREPHAGRASGNKQRKYRRDFGGCEGNRGHQGFGVPWIPSNLGRNRRSVWTITVEHYKGGHFAVFPKRLAELCVLAGSSAKGCCTECGAPYHRRIEIQRTFQSGSGKSGKKPHGKWAEQAEAEGNLEDDIRAGPTTVVTSLGWTPTCECGQTVHPCTVLDPFLGSGTTAVVAENLGRDWIGIELNPQYIELAKRRLREESNRPLIPMSETQEASKMEQPLETDPTDA